MELRARLKSGKALLHSRLKCFGYASILLLVLSGEKEDTEQNKEHYVDEKVIANCNLCNFQIIVMSFHITETGTRCKGRNRTE